MSNIVIIGAGGKMGTRITRNLSSSDYNLHCIEIHPEGIKTLKELGIEPVEPNAALPNADVVILAVPDIAIEAVSQSTVALMKPGSLLLTLDPAAPFAGKLATKKEIAVVVAHPCHPSIFNWESTENDFRDFYGGTSAKQPAVVALVNGSETDYQLGAEITKKIYAPVSHIHRVTLEQMAILEPALVETLGQSCIELIHEGYKHIIDLGVPEPAARDFVLGHLRIQIAVLFGEVNGTFSDAAYKISERAHPILFKSDWKRIFEPEDIQEQVRNISER